ncbi:hypothetical protein L916_12166 [Phytophthora nicotianae]|uniref:DDE Tnp4 domain-containing protein n=1 Tax=Phytophthora nicotianae TaxID=4792 RepID=W2INB4_PHYNI|nr:hypothetical protein L916_12166 [Phytophthora nicotianae]
MASDSDEDLLSLRRAAREMLDMARLKRLHLHGDWERASRLRLQGLSLLYDASRRFSIPRVRFDIEDFTDDTCLTFYRLTHAQLHRLQDCFGLPDVIRTGSHSRTCCSGLEGLCITLHRLSYPNRWLELSRIYGRWPSALRSISERCNALLEGNLDLASSRLHEFAQAIYDQGGELDRVWGFVDGIVRGICRPAGAHAQRSVYNGHKRKHALKFQTVVTPDGMIFHLFGPVEGCRHDIVLLRKPELGNRIRGDERFRGLFIYGDQAYGRTDVFVSPFKGALTPAQAVINSSMPEVRTTVEWSYGQVVNYWGGVDFKRKKCVLVEFQLRRCTR